MSTLASVILIDTFTNRPSASIPGRLFYASDTHFLYRDNGSTWDSYSAIPGITTQTDQTGSRAITSVYHNTDAVPRYVSVTAHSSSAANASILAQTDASNPPTTYVAYQCLPSATNAQSIFFIVLPGNYYKVTVNVGTPGLDIWFEWT